MKIKLTIKPVIRECLDNNKNIICWLLLHGNEKKKGELLFLFGASNTLKLCKNLPDR